MADELSIKLVNAVNRLNTLPPKKANGASYFNIITTLETNWWHIRKAFGNICDNQAAFNIVGFPSTTSRPGVVQAFAKYLTVFEGAILKRSYNNKLTMPVVNAFLPFIRVLVSAADDSAPLCKEIEQLKIALPLLRLLDTNEFLSARDNDNLEHDYGSYALNCVIFFANVMYRVPDVANTLRTHNGHAILTKYSQSKNKLLTLRTLIAQSYLVQDPKGNELPVNDDMLKFIWQTVNRKLERNSAGVGDFTLYGLLVYLHQLLQCSEAYAAGLVRCGFVDSMVAVMTAPLGNGVGQSTAGEKRTCAKICFALALSDCEETVMAQSLFDQKVIAALEGIKNIRKDLCASATAALWRIKLRSKKYSKKQFASTVYTAIISDERSASERSAPIVQSSASNSVAGASSRPATATAQQTRASPVTDTNDLSGVKRQVVICHVSDYKLELVQRIRYELDKFGIKAWLYSDNSQADKYEEMAVAIETSPAILVCYSSEFPDKQYCLIQVSYARQLDRILIPVQLQQCALRKGLGSWLAGKTRYDFTTAEPNSSAFHEQIQKLGRYIVSIFDKLNISNGSDKLSDF